MRRAADLLEGCRKGNQIDSPGPKIASRTFKKVPKARNESQEQKELF